MKYMYAAVTMDIIRNYCFAREPENVFKPDFGRKAFDDVDGFLEASILVSQRGSKRHLTIINGDRMSTFLGLCVSASLCR